MKLEIPRANKERSFCPVFKIMEVTGFDYLYTFADDNPPIFLSSGE